MDPTHNVNTNHEGRENSSQSTKEPLLEINSFGVNVKTDVYLWSWCLSLGGEKWRSQLTAHICAYSIAFVVCVGALGVLFCLFISSIVGGL